MEDQKKNPKQASHRPDQTGHPGKAGPGHAQRRPTSLSELITLQWQHEREDVDLENFLLAIYFMRLGTLVDRAYDRHCQKNFGVNGGDMRLMLALRRGGPPYVKRPTDLFRSLLVTSGAITKKVDRLVQISYVERLPDPNHSGGFLVHLTKTGLQVVEQAVEHLAKQSVLAPAMSQLGPDERRRGSEFVLRVLSSLESSETHPLEEDQESSAKRIKPKR